LKKLLTFVAAGCFAADNTDAGPTFPYPVYVKWAEAYKKETGVRLSVVDQANPNAWPVSSASFIIMYKNPKNKEQSADVLKFFDWAFMNDKTLALELGYVPLPDTLTN
jgi:ABC-type phosphate transport system substrate-binding protein